MTALRLLFQPSRFFVGQVVRTTALSGHLSPEQIKAEVRGPHEAPSAHTEEPVKQRFVQWVLEQRKSESKKEGCTLKNQEVRLQDATDQVRPQDTQTFALVLPVFFNQHSFAI